VVVKFLYNTLRLKAFNQQRRATPYVGSEKGQSPAPIPFGTSPDLTRPLGTLSQRRGKEEKRVWEEKGKRRV